MDYEKKQPSSQQERQQPQSRRSYSRGKGPRKLSPTAQLLVDAALDVAGLLCLAAFAQAVGYPLPLPAESLALLAAGADLLLRNSLRGLALDLLRGLLGQLQALARRLRVYWRRRRRGEDGPLPEPHVVLAKKGDS